MAKKTKSKARLDKFYKIAKEQGFRSRAAFKLIQLNQKYNFLQNSSVLIDLCAAPGGWLQVASKYMSTSSIIVGVDLDPIKPIPNVITFQNDITTQACLNQIKGEIKHLKADVVLHDGSPNVGANWNKDAYNQSELVLMSLKLATQVLVKNGLFITKIFRSADYNSLIWVLQKLFRKVEAFKPEASRLISAEIYVVCQEYLAPDVIDPKFFNPQFVFKTSEADQQDIQNSEVQNINQIFQKKKKRYIDDNVGQSMHKKISLKQFLDTENPYSIFASCNQIVIDEDSLDYKEFVNFPRDFEEMCQDLKLLNKKQVQQIIRWRAKVKQRLNKTSIKSEYSMEIQKDNEEKFQEQSNEKKDKKEDKNIIKFLKQSNQFQQNKENNVTGNENEGELEEVDFNQFGKEMRKGKYMDLQEEEENIRKQEEKRKAEKKRKINSYQEMGKNIEYLYEKGQRENIMKKEEDKQLTQEISQNQKKGKQKEEIEESDLGKNLEQQKKQLIRFETGEIVRENELKNSKWFGKEIFSWLKQTISEKDNQNKQGKIKNQSSKEKQINQKQTEQKEKPRKVREKQLDFSKMTDDELAEMRVISKKMLRKKERMQIIDDSYNRYNYLDDPQNLPEWFVEDEKKHIGKIQQVTKEEIQAEKERLYQMRNQIPKKQLEAKFRKYKKIAKTMQKVNKESNKIFEDEAITDYCKSQQINKLYRKALKGNKSRKKLIFVKKNSQVNYKHSKGKNFKLVDKRMKKDIRGQNKYKRRRHR